MRTCIFGLFYLRERAFTNPFPPKALIRHGLARPHQRHLLRRERRIRRACAAAQEEDPRRPLQSPRDLGAGRE